MLEGATVPNPCWQGGRRPPRTGRVREWVVGPRQVPMGELDVSRRPCGERNPAAARRSRSMAVMARALPHAVRAVAAYAAVIW
jgi:hypothetical protein